MGMSVGVCAFAQSGACAGFWQVAFAGCHAVGVRLHAVLRSSACVGMSVGVCAFAQSGACAGFWQVAFAGCHAVGVRMRCC